MSQCTGPKFSRHALERAVERFSALAGVSRPELEARLTAALLDGQSMPLHRDRVGVATRIGKARAVIVVAEGTGTVVTVMHDTASVGPTYTHGAIERARDRFPSLASLTRPEIEERLSACLLAGQVDDTDSRFPGRVSILGEMDKRRVRFVVEPTGRVTNVINTGPTQEEYERVGRQLKHQTLVHQHSMKKAEQAQYRRRRGGWGPRAKRRGRRGGS